MQNEIVKVGFEGGEVEALQDADGKIWIGVKRVCEELGIDSWRQSEKLKKKNWAVTNIILATGPDSKRYQTLMILLRSFPMWLATIDANRVKKEVRPKLEAFQDKATDALEKFFLGGAIVPKTMEEALVIALEAEREKKALVLANKELSNDKAIILKQNDDMRPFYNLGKAAYETPSIITVEEFAKTIVIDGKLTIGSRIIWQYFYFHRMLKRGDVHGQKQHQLPFDWCREWFCVRRIPKRVFITNIGEFEIVNFMMRDPRFYIWSREHRNDKVAKNRMALLAVPQMKLKLV